MAAVPKSTVIYGRRSVRSYARKPLDASTIRALLDAAVQAPTAVHEQPGCSWHAIAPIVVGVPMGTVAPLPRREPEIISWR